MISLCVAANWGSANLEKSSSKAPSSFALVNGLPYTVTTPDASMNRSYSGGFDLRASSHPAAAADIDCFAKSRRRSCFTRRSFFASSAPIESIYAAAAAGKVGCWLAHLGHAGPQLDSALIGRTILTCRGVRMILPKALAKARSLWPWGSGGSPHTFAHTFFSGWCMLVRKGIKMAILLTRWFMYWLRIKTCHPAKPLSGSTPASGTLLVPLCTLTDNSLLYIGF